MGGDGHCNTERDIQQHGSWGRGVVGSEGRRVAGGHHTPDAHSSYFSVRSISLTRSTPSKFKQCGCGRKRGFGGYRVGRRRGRGRGGEKGSRSVLLQVFITRDLHGHKRSIRFCFFFWEYLLIIIISFTTDPFVSVFVSFSFLPLFYFL